MKKDDNELTQISRKVHKTQKGNAYTKQNNIFSTNLNSKTLILRVFKLCGLQTLSKGLLLPIGNSLYAVFIKSIKPEGAH